MYLIIALRVHSKMQWKVKLEKKIKINKWLLVSQKMIRLAPIRITELAKLC